MPRAADEGTNALLYEGATITQLVRIFGGDPADVKAKLHGLIPTRFRAGAPVYKLKDAAALLVPLPPDVVERVLRMNHTDLPKMLSKEFWFAQNQKANYDERMGDLWRTTDVIELAGEAFKTLRLSLMLMADAVEREDTLSETQRQIITRLVDTTLRDMKEKLVDGFTKQKRRKSAVSKPEPSEDDDGSADL